MAGIDFSQPILGAGASAKTDYAAAQARTGLNFIGAARFKRGIKVELGAEAFANASAGLSKFIHASIEGTAFARAQAGIQLQLPLNLFDEFGFSARAEAIAEAAAGVEASLGLSIGDFVLLAKRDPNLIGLPLEILLLFLEEVSIGGAFEINVSASAKAHASISVAGTIIEKAGDKAGFYFTIDAGAGLAAGAGMGFKAGAEFKDFRRFFGRAVDRTVDTTIREILQVIPDNLRLAANNDVLKPWFEAFGPVAKIALRIAYDIGLKIAENNPGRTQNDTMALCEEAVKTFLEECQRFIFTKLLESGINSIKNLLEQQVPNLLPGTWNGVIQQRTALAEHLLAMPDEPFQDSEENLAYWEALLQKSAALVSAIGNPDPGLDKAIAIIYCTSELMMEAIRAKINTASAYATAIGAGAVNTDAQPFKGQLHNQPAPGIAATIKQVLGRNPSGFTYADLLQFLVNDTIVTGVLTAFPSLNRFMNIFKDDFSGKAENEILKLFLKNAGSFDLTNPNAAQADPHQLLNLIVQSLNKFLTNKFKADILPQILSSISDPTLRLYIEEVLFASVVYMKDVGLNTILNWDKESFDNDDFTESLAGVIMLLLGRTVVITADTFLTATQEQVRRSCNEVAAMIRDYAADPAGDHQGLQDIIPHMDPDLINLTADCVEIAGLVLGPLRDDTRSRVRNLLYQVFETLPPGQQQDFLTSLGDDFFIPNVDQLQQLTNELATISKDRFIQFAEQFILKTGDYILGKLEELILEIIDLVVQWEKHLADVLLTIAGFLKDLEEKIKALNQELINLMATAKAALDNLFQTLGSSTLKNKIRNDIKRNFAGKALNALEDNDLYKVLPAEWRRNIRGLIDGAVNAAIDNSFTSPVFNAIGALANQLEDILPDLRQLDPDENLPEQLMLLILDKVEENIKNHYGGGKPQISLTLRYGYTEWVVDSIIPPGGHWETKYLTISLGSIEINLNPFIDIVRNAIESLNFYHNTLNAACFKLGSALAKELELTAQQLLHEEKKQEQERLAKINSEHNNAPKEIAILSPLALSHFTSAIDVRIHFGGVPASCLGLGKDEMQRVLIYINGELIPTKSLLIEGTGLDDKNGPGHRKDFDFKNLISVNEKTGSISNSFDAATGIIRTSKATIITDTAAHYPAQQANRETAYRPTQYAFSNSRLEEQATSKVIYKAGTKNPGTGRQYMERSSRTIGEGKGKGKAVHSYEIKNSLPGRSIFPGQMNNLLKESIPGLFIQFKVELDEPFIAEGVNVLTVVVIERGGDRHQQNVSFTVSHEPVSLKPKPGVFTAPNLNTGKPETAMMTLNNVIHHFAGNGKQNKGSLDDYLAAMDKGKINKVKPQKTPLIGLEKPVYVSMKKIETVALIQKSEKGESPVEKPLEITYNSEAERKKILAERGWDNKTLAKKNQRLKTENVRYEKSHSLIRDDQKEISSVKQVSSFIKKEELWLLDEKGKPAKTVTIKYATQEEKRAELAKLKIDIGKLRTKGVETEEQISILDLKGHTLDTYLKPDKPVQFKEKDILTYRPDLIQKKKFTDTFKRISGIDPEEKLRLLPQADKEKKAIRISTNPGARLNSEGLAQRIKSSRDYLDVQSDLNFKDQNHKS